MKVKEMGVKVTEMRLGVQWDGREFSGIAVEVRH